MRSLLQPRSIAVLGASDNPRKLSGRPLNYLKRFGYQGNIYPINAHRSTVQGLPAYASLDDVPDELDLVMIMLPAGQVPDAVRACGVRGVGAVIVAASGFAETGDVGASLQAQLRAAIDEAGVRVLGPNCLGLMNVATGAFPTFTTALDEDVPLETGPLAFVSQSGAFGSFIFSAAQAAGIGISHYVNTGNEVDLTVAELLDALLETDGVEVLLAYLEGVHEGDRLLEVARRAHGLDTPIVMVKVGTSDSGARAAHSHTASLVGEDAVFDALVRRHGIVRVDGIETMLDAAQVFTTGRRVRGRNLTVLTLSGGAGVLMADAATAHGLVVDTWDADWQERMGTVLPAYGSPRNPVDFTGTLVAEPGLLRPGLQVAIDHPGTDMIAVLLGNADACADELVSAIDEMQRVTEKPVVTVWTGGSGRPRARLRELGIPCFSDPGRAAAALAALTDFSLRAPLPRPTRPPGIDDPAARAVIAQARQTGLTQLDEHTSSRLISAYGIPCAPSLAVPDVESAVAAFDELGGPVALKLLSDRVAHKSDIGGVHLGLETADDVRAAATELTGLVPGTRLLVQRMERGTELIVGLKHDAAFGPVVVAGLGGMLVEVLDDSTAAKAPVDIETARGMLQGLRGSRVLDAVRGRSAKDVDAASEVLVRLSWMAADLGSDIAELDVNPLLLGAVGEGAVAVDCLALLRETPGE
ncbi:acetate--CoA ligase family protein [Pseudonocardia sp. MH-G8]|uniref:acetate--CoA ligase family protein n=1 Tax=Pseudonocardia sp. MH-G8 TaxID=1854588 RepID=UPI0013045A90|nr:acetate--CoA ligase family protein [Pseudonocardia sp. MH-G8]